MKEDLKKIKAALVMDPIKKSILFSLLFVSTILTIMLPLITVDLIDTITNSQNMSQLVKNMLIYFTVSVIQIIFESILEIYCTMKEFDFTQVLKLKTIEKMFLLRGSFFNEEKSGNLYTVIEDDTGKVVEFIYRTYKVLASFIQALAVLGVLVYLDWKIAIMVIAMLPIVIIIQNHFGKQLKNKAEENRQDYGNNNALTEEFVSNASAMILFGIRKSFIKKYRKSLEKLRASFKKLMIMNELSNQSVGVTTTIGLILITGYGGYEVFEKKISIGILVVFIQYCSRFISPFEKIIMLRVSFNLIRPSLNRVNGILSQNYNTGKILENEEISDIQLQDVCFGYKSNQQILNEVILRFEKNKKYLICGKSGIGKSTIINLILGFWKPNSGKILINNIHMEDLNIDELRCNISVVSQKTFFLHDTIYNNLSSFKENINEEQVWSVLREVDMYNDVNKMPVGLNTMIGDDGMTLSGGQRQRLAIARALLKNSDVIIFDEPTSALDKKTEEIIVKTIKCINNKIVIIVSHSSSFSNIVDITYKMSENNISMNEVDYGNQNRKSM